MSSSLFSVNLSHHSREQEGQDFPSNDRSLSLSWSRAKQGFSTPGCCFQVQSIEFTQIEMKVMEGLQVGNECLNKMHQVGPHGVWQAGGRAQLQGPGDQGEFVPHQGLSSWIGGCASAWQGPVGPEGGVAQHGL